MNTPYLKIRLYGDPCLREKSIPVKEIGPAQRILIQSMIKAMYKSKGIGLAAPQVGINQRFFVADIGDGPMVLINPQIIKKWGEGVLEEGCLSLPDVNISVKRAQKIRVRYINENSEVVEGTCEGLLARVFMHEIDHLDGKLIIDHANEEEREKLKNQIKDIEERQKEDA